MSDLRATKSLASVKRDTLNLNKARFEEPRGEYEWLIMMIDEAVARRVDSISVVGEFSISIPAETQLRLDGFIITYEPKSVRVSIP